MNSVLLAFRTRLALLAAAGAVAAIVLAPGCSFATNDTAVQCASEAECLSKGPAFAGTTCDPNTKTCIAVAADKDLCKTNQECIEKAGGVPAICRKRDHKCVNLQTTECPTVLQKGNQLIDDNTIVVGALTPAGSIELGDADEAGMKLAQDELSTQVRGLPSPDGSAAVRPFVILACREFNPTGFAGLNVAANHLVKDLDVPLVIGPIDPANANFVLNEVFIPNKTLNILPTAVSQNLYNIPSPIAPSPIMWSAALTDTGTTTAAQEFISKQLIAKLQAEGVSPPYRVALMQEDDFFGEGAATRMEERLNFNGKNAADNSRDGNYLRVNIGNLIDPVGNPAPEAKVAAAIQSIIDFKPHIVLHAYGPIALTRVFFNLINQWPPALQHAYHLDILTTWSSFAPLLDLLSAVPPIRNRVFPSVAHQNADQVARAGQFVIRYKALNKQFLASRTPTQALVQNWYDATYMAAYAIVANQAKPLTGANIAQTLPRLQPPGQLIRTGTEDITKAFTLLNSGQGIDLDGLSGHMNLDTRTGAPSPDYDIDIVCPELDVTSGRIVGFTNSGFYTVNGVGTGVLSDKGQCAKFPPGP